MNRNDFYFRQRVTQDELDGGFSRAEAADLAIVKDVLGFGLLVTGAEPATVVESGPVDQNVSASVLLGYDQLGRRLSNLLSGFQGGLDKGLPPQPVDMTVDEVGSPTSVAIPGNERILSIFVEFERKLSDPRTDGNAATVFFVRDESIKFNVAQSAEAGVGLAVPQALRPDQILLADVTRIFGQTTFANADIDQTRRQAFLLALPHGANHVETGSDPVPNATGGAGGLMSAVDKTRFDILPETATDVAALFPTQAKPFQPANIAAPSATSLDVSTQMSAKTPGGSSSVEAVVTTPPNNRVIIRDDNFDDFVDANNNKVFGRLTEAAGVWTLSFVVVDETSGEIAFDMTPFAATTILWYVQEAYSLENLPTFDPAFSIPSDQVAAEYPFPIGIQDAGGGPLGGAPGQFSHIKQGSSITLVDEGSGICRIDGSGGAVPVGAVITWWRPTVATAIPVDYQTCDGSVISDAGSPFNTQNTPNLQDRFIKGINNAAIATYGGPGAPTTVNPTHSHSGGSHSHSGGSHTHSTPNHTHSITSDGGHTHQWASSGGANRFEGQIANPGITDNQGVHSHTGSTGSGGASNTGSASGSTGSSSAGTSSNAAEPNYIGLLYLIKIK